MKELNKEDCLNAIKDINHVENFDPDLIASDIVVGDKKTKYLPLIYKKAWCRMKFPSYRIEYSEKEINMEHNFVHVKARVYEEKSDIGENYIGEGEAYVYKDPTKLGSDALIFNDMYLLARGSAASKALTDAGFGLSFYIDDPELIPERKSESKNETNKANPILRNSGNEKKHIAASTPPIEIALETADKMTPAEINSYKIDIGNVFIEKGTLIKDVSPQELLWIFSNTKSHLTKAVCIKYAKANIQFEQEFVNAGIPI